MWRWLNACLFMPSSPAAKLPHERLELVQTTAALPVASLWAALPLAHTSVRCSIISCLDPWQSIQEESGFCILYHPLEALLQVQARHGTAGHNVPFVCLDSVESQSLYAVSIGPPTSLSIPSRRPPCVSRPRSSSPARRSCF